MPEEEPLELLDEEEDELDELELEDELLELELLLDEEDELDDDEELLLLFDEPTVTARGALTTYSSVALPITTL